MVVDKFRGVASSIIEGVHIHMFVFTDRKNNGFQRKYINDAEHEYINIKYAFKQDIRVLGD